jgi:hypothetical protein
MDKAYSLPLAVAPEHASSATFDRFYISRPRGGDQSVLIPGRDNGRRSAPSDGANPESSSMLDLWIPGSLIQVG